MSHRSKRLKCRYLHIKSIAIRYIKVHRTHDKDTLALLFHTGQINKNSPWEQKRNNGHLMEKKHEKKILLINFEIILAQIFW